MEAGPRGFRTERGGAARSAATIPPERSERGPAGRLRPPVAGPRASASAAPSGLPSAFLVQSQDTVYLDVQILLVLSVFLAGFLVGENRCVGK